MCVGARGEMRKGLGRGILPAPTRPAQPCPIPPRSPSLAAQRAPVRPALTRLVLHRIPPHTQSHFRRWKRGGIVKNGYAYHLVDTRIDFSSPPSSVPPSGAVRQRAIRNTDKPFVCMGALRRQVNKIWPRCRNRMQTDLVCHVTSQRRLLLTTSARVLYIYYYCKPCQVT